MIYNKVAYNIKMDFDRVRKLMMMLWLIAVLARPVKHIQV